MLETILQFGALLSLPFVVVVLLGVNFLPTWMSSRWAVALATGIGLIGSNMYLL